MKKYLKVTYLSTCFLLIFCFILSYYDWQLRGYWTEKIIVWLWIISTILVIIKFRQQKLVKIYTTLLALLIVLSILPMGIPFFAFIAFISTIGDYQRIDLHDNYRLELTQHQALSLPQVYIYQTQYTIFEKNILRTSYEDIVTKTLNISPSDYDKLNAKIWQQKPQFDHVKLIQTNEQGLTIHYTIDNQSKTIFHPFSNHQGY